MLTSSTDSSYTIMMMIIKLLNLTTLRPIISKPNHNTVTVEWNATEWQIPSVNHYETSKYLTVNDTQSVIHSQSVWNWNISVTNIRIKLRTINPTEGRITNATSMWWILQWHEKNTIQEWHSRQHYNHMKHHRGNRLSSNKINMNHTQE